MLLTAMTLPAQVRKAGDEIAPKVFLYCDYCDFDFIRKRISLVNFVRERLEADIFIQVLYQTTASDGSEYTFDFTGKNLFSGLNDTLKLNLHVTATQNEKREKFLEVLKLGLIRFMARTDLKNKISISYKGNEMQPEEMPDNWDSWYFNLGVNGWFNGEQTTKTMSTWSNLSANRVTEELKMSFGYNLNYNENKYNYRGLDYLSISRSHSFTAFMAKSFGEHWSAGGWIYMNTSTYNNIDFAMSVAPAIEYNIFPYSESVRKQLRISYQIYPKYFKYIEQTIYSKNKELLAGQELAVGFSYILPWGHFNLSLTGQTYLHDLAKNRLDIFTTISVKMFKGLSADISANYSSVHNQLSLPWASATIEEVLLQRKMLETQYNYWLSIGLSYSFGSIYQNVVNPRFGN